tara:strand:- start:1582 stop:1698 length:117 start_codon:yes stop_codon:yes gene_type:complete
MGNGPYQALIWLKKHKNEVLQTDILTQLKSLKQGNPGF